MRLLADENIPYGPLNCCEERGMMSWPSPKPLTRACGEDVMALVVEEWRILLAFDKDFGELAYSSKPHLSGGIILFQIPLRPADYIATMVAEVLDSKCDWPGQFAVVEPGLIRLRGR